MKRSFRSVGGRLGLMVLAAMMFVATLIVSPAPAEAGCYTRSVCSYRYGRRICRVVRTCSSVRTVVRPAVRRCYNRQYCTYRFGRRYCTYRRTCGVY